MSKFKFRLETLLKLREGIRDERRAALAEAFYAEQLLEGRILEIDGEHSSLREQRSQIASSGDVAVDQLLEIQRYEAILAAELKTIAGQREMLEAEITRRREATAEADQEVRVLEKLRERQQQRHDSQVELKLLKELDEFASLSHRRKDKASCHD